MNRFNQITLTLLSALIAALSSLTAPCFAQTKQSPPLLQIEKGEVALGNLTPRDGLTTTVELTNTGTDPLTILRAQGSCPCLAITVRDKQLEPGETTQLVIGIDVPEDIGPFVRTVQVICQDYTMPFQFRVLGDITYGVYVNKGSAQQLMRTSGIFSLESLDGELFNVLSVSGEAPVFMPVTDGTKETLNAYVLRYDFSNRSLEDMPRWVVVETDHPQAPLIDIKFANPDVWAVWRPVDRWRVFEERLNLHDVKAGEWREASASLTGVPFKPTVTVQVRSSNPEIEVRLKEVRKPTTGGGTECVFELRVPDADRGYFSTVLYFIKDGEESGLDVFGRAVEEVTDAPPTPTPIIKSKSGGK